MLFVGLTFGGVTLIIVGAYWLLVAAPEARERDKLRQRIRGMTSEGGQIKVSLAREEGPLSEIGPLNAALKRSTRVTGAVKRLLDEADVRITPGAFILMTVAAFLIGTLAVQYFVGFWILWLLGGALLAFAPLAVVRFKRARRLRLFEEQFPESIELIARALRAGHAFSTGLKIAADELPPPVGPEFKLLFDRQNFGGSLPDALRLFGSRIPLIDARFFVTAVLTQREAGGNLAEVLDRLAAVMRDRFRVRRDVRVKSAHGRITAFVLAGMPPAVAMTMMVVSPEQVTLLVTDPLGQRMLMGAALLQVIGTLVIRKIIDLRY